MTVSGVPPTIFAHAAGQNSAMMTRQSLITIYVKSGFLRGCSGGASINSNLMIGIRSDS